MTSTTVDQSIEQIEVKIAFLESAVGELSDVVFRQQREIQELESQIETLKDRLEASPEPDNPAGPNSEKPPHY